MPDLPKQRREKQRTDSHQEHKQVVIAITYNKGTYKEEATKNGLKLLFCVPVETSWATTDFAKVAGKQRIPEPRETPHPPGEATATSATRPSSAASPAEAMVQSHHPPGVPTANTEAWEEREKAYTSSVLAVLQPPPNYSRLWLSAKAANPQVSPMQQLASARHGWVSSGLKPESCQRERGRGGETLEESWSFENPLPEKQQAIRKQRWPLVGGGSASDPPTQRTPASWEVLESHRQMPPTLAKRLGTLCSPGRLCPHGYYAMHDVPQALGGILLALCIAQL